MAQGPSVIVCLDGIDGVGKSSAASLVGAFMDIPVITGGRKWDGTPWPVELKKNTDLLIMNTLNQLGKHRPSIILDRCMVSTVVYNPTVIVMSEVPWETFYPKDKTVFITIVDNIEECIRREDLQPYHTLVQQRIHEQQRFLDMSQWLGHRGYKTRIAQGHQGVMHIANAIREEIRLVQRSILEVERGEE